MKNVLLINSGRKAVGCALQERDDILLSVISMPGYLDWYDAGTDLEVVDTIENLDLVRAAALRIRERNPFDYVVAPSEWSTLPEASSVPTSASPGRASTWRTRSPTSS